MAKRNKFKYDFYTRFAKILNSGQSRSIVMYGNVSDLYWDGEKYLPFIPFMLKKTEPANRIQIVYELNGPIRISEEDKKLLRDCWIKWKIGIDVNDLILKNLRSDIKNIKKGVAEKSEEEKFGKQFDDYMNRAIIKSGQALEFMRQMCICSRECPIEEEKEDGTKTKRSLLFFIEGADMLLPAGKGDVSSLTDAQLRRIFIVQDWFSEAEFVNGRDSVCFVAESPSLIHERISKMPQVMSVEVPSPDTEKRAHYIEKFCKFNEWDKKDVWDDRGSLSVATAGLSIHALRQLLIGAKYEKIPLTYSVVIDKVEEFIKSQLGEDVVEFMKPEHSLKDVVGATRVKEFIKNYLIKKFTTTDKKKAISGCAVAGSIGSGKTFIFVGMAAELGMVVLVLKNLRSQWFGGTDLIFERLKRVLTVLEKVCILLDEADTQFGGVGAGEHATERRLTGKIQGMMSDTKLKGKIIWLLMTARINLLSADIRRPGRAGDLIIPIFDPEGDDRKEFVEWALKSSVEGKPEEEKKSIYDAIDSILPSTYSAASFASLMSYLADYEKDDMTQQHIIDLVQDLIPADIGKTREYQKLQALINCTRKSLLPPEYHDKDMMELKETWRQQIQQLELEGVS
jgi:hypothetical protein